jgi:hypothetical protein
MTGHREHPIDGDEVDALTAAGRSCAASACIGGAGQRAAVKRIASKRARRKD